MSSHWDEVCWGARLADMQQVEYQNTLAVATLIALLLDKGIVTAEELRRTSQALDAAAAPPLARLRPTGPGRSTRARAGKGERACQRSAGPGPR